MSTPPAGWYPDPGMAQTQRYWDGAAWTAHIAPLAPSAPPQMVAPASDHGPQTPEHWLLPVGRSGAAIAGADKWELVRDSGAASLVLLSTVVLSVVKPFGRLRRAGRPPSRKSARPGPHGPVTVRGWSTPIR